MNVVKILRNLPSTFVSPKTINSKLLDNIQSSNLRQSIIVACIMNAAYQQSK